MNNYQNTTRFFLLHFRMNDNYILYFILLFLFLTLSSNLKSQCFNAPYGLYPTATFNPTCNTTCTFQNITTLGYAGEYSNVNVISGNTYRFRSSITTDFITISNATGTTAYISGVGGAGGITWTSTITGTVRFYTHLNTACGTANTSRTRSVCCISSAPAYNPCNSIPVISCGTNINVVFNTGTGVYNPPATTCGFATPGYEYIYSFTPSVTGIYMISQPTSFGYIDYFYKTASAGCSNTGWTCIDDISNANTGNNNTLLNLTGGTTYYILLDAESTTGGNVTFSISCAISVPSNDLCANAISVSPPYSSSVLTTLGTTTDVPTSTSVCGSQSNNLWFKTVGTGYTMEASTCSINTNFDTEIKVYTGSCASLNTMVEIICNDDDGTCSINSTNSKVEWCSQTGVTYFISVGYWTTGTVTGNFQLSLNNTLVCSVLPVELISFTGTIENNNAHLKWVTASELHCEFYTLERSTDLNQWTEINRQTAIGSNSNNSQYEFTDTDLEKGIYYYRLSQTDFNGTRENLRVVSVEIENELFKCEDIFYDLSGKQVSSAFLSSGIYLRKCGNEFKKVFILSN